MKRSSVWVWLVLSALLGLGLALACTSGGDDDDNDAADDDAADDAGDAAGDDTGDDATGEEVWTDPDTGLTWQVTTSSYTMNWEDANSYCDNLTLAGGGWHLPTISELRTLIRGCSGTVSSGSCGVTDSCLALDTCYDDSCGGCSEGGGPNNGCYGPPEPLTACAWLWSSSAVEDYPTEAWLIYFSYGEVATFPEGADEEAALCVR